MLTQDSPHIQLESADSTCHKLLGVCVKCLAYLSSYVFAAFLEYEDINYAIKIRHRRTLQRAEEPDSKDELKLKCCTSASSQTVMSEHTLKAPLTSITLLIIHPPVQTPTIACSFISAHCARCLRHITTR